MTSFGFHGVLRAKSKVLFSFLKQRNDFFGTENGKEIKNTNQCLGCLRMEDQGVLSHQTFLLPSTAVITKQSVRV